MAKRQLAAVLWRRLNKATFDTLAGISRGQYDIRLTSDPDVEAFFSGMSREKDTDLGGFEITVPVETFEGDGRVESTQIVVRFMGEGSQRKDWYVRAQRPGTAYPLWGQGRGAPQTFEEANADFLLILRDADGRYHCRWISSENFSNLPEPIRSRMSSRDAGVYLVSGSTTG